MLKMLRFPALGEVGVVALIVAIVSLMILPLPPWLIDALLAINISLSVIMLMTTMYVSSIVSLSSFPSVLLFTTLYRLSLNIASTKSILLHAEAGHIIDSFGRLVVGGNLVVGLVVFLVITTVQFIVIAKGSERVAEVGARFSLDAMPGKQLSIDGDLRANNINADEARRRRALLATESQLHGGMDGAIKFVKGDAIAGILITFVNIFGGIAVGMAYHGMTAAQAANRFAILSVGDAMVSQIPSLLISVAAGVMITRVSDAADEGEESSLGRMIGNQFSGSPAALLAASVLLCGFAAVPGFPTLMFLLLAATLAGCGGFMLKRKRKGDVGKGPSLKAMQSSTSRMQGPVILARAPLFSCPLAVRLSSNLAASLNPAALNRAFDAERSALEEELGLPFPGITLWTGALLPDDTYEILVHDVPFARHELSATAHLPLQDGSRVARSTISLNRQSETSASPEARLAHESIVVLRHNAHLFFGIQEAQWVLDRIGQDSPGIVSELNKVLPPQKVADVLRRLLEEQIPIRDLRTILQSLIVWGPKEKDPVMLTEYIRGDLGRLLAHRATQGGRKLSAVLFEVSAEQHIRQSLKQTPSGNFLALPPEQIEYFVGAIQGFVGDRRGDCVAVVTSMDIRRYVRRMLESKLNWLNVYSYQELREFVDLYPLGKVSLEFE
ncbi:MULTISPECIES: type III secretion system export apparatus subunit SctV [unclassified Caballeronia]|uniref:type III secretion system export apparatus subunit SctV n=1 Tax=unclassified Caballeronia TaxID=2646786 RepID=UPI0020288036|nr:MULTISPECIES: type III secretion system export apparatus subunit SctV [unclassified Caballeronia]